MTKYSRRHGGCFDRGSADSYYRRGMEPHYFVAGTHTSAKVEKAEMTEDEIKAYEAGYEENENAGNFKDCG